MLLVCFQNTVVTRYIKTNTLCIIVGVSACVYFIGILLLLQVFTGLVIALGCYYIKNNFRTKAQNDFQCSDQFVQHPSGKLQRFSIKSDKSAVTPLPVSEERVLERKNSLPSYVINGTSKLKQESSLERGYLAKKPSKSQKNSKKAGVLVKATTSDLERIDESVPTKVLVSKTKASSKPLWKKPIKHALVNARLSNMAKVRRKRAEGKHALSNTNKSEFKSNSHKLDALKRADTHATEESKDYTEETFSVIELMHPKTFMSFQ